MVFRAGFIKATTIKNTKTTNTTIGPTKAGSIWSRTSPYQTEFDERIQTQWFRACDRFDQELHNHSRIVYLMFVASLRLNPPKWFLSSKACRSQVCSYPGLWPGPPLQRRIERFWNALEFEGS